MTSPEIVDLCLICKRTYDKEYGDYIGVYDPEREDIEYNHSVCTDQECIDAYVEKFGIPTNE